MSSPECTGSIEVRRFSPAARADFDRLTGWCACVAWWVPTWDGWGERTAEMNRACRDDACAHGEWDGYLVYEDGAAVGWCQVGPRDRLAKLVAQYQLAPDPAAWAITCFVVAPDERGQGHAARLLAGVLDDLRARGVARVEAFPRRGEGLPPDDVWTGPERLFRGAGFEVVREHEKFPVLAKTLG